MNYEINRNDKFNIKITATENIPIEESIGFWVTTEPMSTRCRYLFQGQMRKKWWETDDLGRYCNHSLTPNTTVVSQGDRLELKANRKIEYGEEVLVDYRKITEFTGYIPEINF